MLYAETHGKLGRDGSRAHDRAEDLLTSTCFQLLRYLPLDVGLLAVLKRVRAVAADGSVTIDCPTWLALDGVTRAEYTPWPWWAGCGVPDVVVELFAGAELRCRFVVEVKLDAGKSGEAGEEDATPDTPARDQLHRYWRGLHADGAFGSGVVYLTSHAIPPADELSASVACEPGEWLGWLSWRDVWAAMKSSELLPAQDLAAILAAKGLKGFDGFGAKPWFPPHPPKRVWLMQWFAQPAQAFPTPARQWTSTEEAT